MGEIYRDLENYGFSRITANVFNLVLGKYRDTKDVDIRVTISGHRVKICSIFFIDSACKNRVLYNDIIYDTNSLDSVLDGLGIVRKLVPSVAVDKNNDPPCDAIAGLNSEHFPEKIAAMISFSDCINNMDTLFNLCDQVSLNASNILKTLNNNRGDNIDPICGVSRNTDCMSVPEQLNYKISDLQSGMSSILHILDSINEHIG
jgi:hypothetical protein